VEVDHVEAFVAIVRRGGFTPAARTLHLSQPAISRRVRLLEAELGAPVFERVRSGVVLTDAGRAFLPHAEALLASMRDGIEAVAALRGGDHGSVALAVVGTLASTSLTERLRRFRERHGGVDLRLRTALSAEVSGLVRRGDATLGLRYDADPHRRGASRGDARRAADPGPTRQDPGRADPPPPRLSLGRRPRARRGAGGVAGGQLPR
jgi:DNA-binding transcriptional LysR family regulator